MSNPGNQGPQRSETGDVFLGIGLTLLLHLIQFPLTFLSGGVTLAGIGVSQLLYVVPAVIIASRKDRKGMVKGIIIMAAITFLLNAACWGLFMAAFVGLS